METIKNYFNLMRMNLETHIETNPVTMLSHISENAFVCELKTENSSDSQRIFMFAIDNQAMFVLLDNVYNDCDSDEATELADEEEFNDEDPLYFSSCSHRVSPVFYLRSIADRFLDGYRNAADEEFDPENIFYCLISSAYFINKEDMWDNSWDKKKMIVCDKHRFENDSLEIKKSNIAKDRFAKNISLNIVEILNGTGLSCPECTDYTLFDTLLQKFIDENSKENKDEDNKQTSIDFDDDDFDLDIDFGDEEEENEEEEGVSEDMPNFFMSAEEEAREKRRKSKVFDPKIGDWQNYVNPDDPDFFEFSNGEKKPVKVAGHKIYEPIENGKTLLDTMIGMKDMKGYVSNLITYNLYNKMLQEQYGDKHDISLHAIFSGNPGTGKTSLASILGSLLKEAGVLSKGHVVVCDRSTFCSSQWWGGEERAVNQIVKIARGGVLFIDEAYNLVSDHPHDPGRQVIPNLLTLLADERNRDICVILAGYPKEMNKLISTNPGIDSRFPNRFEFRDYTIDELVTIATTRVERFGYKFTPKAKTAFKELLEKYYNTRNKSAWGNARVVTNLLDKTYVLHAIRVMGSGHKNANEIDRSKVHVLTAKDIPAFVMPEEQQAKPHIGFM